MDNEHYELDWPTEEDKTIPFYLLAGAVRKAFDYTFKMKDIAPDSDIPWSGPQLGKHERATCLTPIEKLKNENLQYELEDQGRDKLDALISLAIQIGIEQGRRCLRSEEKIWLDIKNIKENEVIQFERFGFCRLDSENEFWYTHS